MSKSDPTRRLATASNSRPAEAKPEDGLQARDSRVAAHEQAALDERADHLLDDACLVSGRRWVWKRFYQRANFSMRRWSFETRVASPHHQMAARESPAPGFTRTHALLHSPLPARRPRLRLDSRPASGQSVHMYGRADDRIVQLAV